MLNKNCPGNESLTIALTDLRYFSMLAKLVKIARIQIVKLAKLAKLVKIARAK